MELQCNFEILIQKNDNQCDFWQNLKTCIFKISASCGCVAQGLAVYLKLATVISGV